MNYNYIYTVIFCVLHSIYSQCVYVYRLVLWLRIILKNKSRGNNSREFRESSRNAERETVEIPDDTIQRIKLITSYRYVYLYGI